MKNIVVIADKPGGKNVALQRALSLHQQTGAKITLLGFAYASIGHVSDPALSKLSHKDLESKIIAQRQLQLQQVVNAATLQPSTITIKALWGKHIAPEINTYCSNHPVDLVIKSAHRSETLLYTPTDWQLIRECSAPVMITASKSWKKKARIVAALDFSTSVKSKIKLNHSIMRQAQSLAQLLNEEVHIAFALTIPQPLADMDLIDPRKYGREKRQQLKPVIDLFCKEYGIDSSCVHIKQGSPDKIIPSIANQLKADVVVTGTVGRKGIKGKLIGNTAEGILSKLHTDIIAVKPS